MHFSECKNTECVFASFRFLVQTIQRVALFTRTNNTLFVPSGATENDARLSRFASKLPDEVELDFHPRLTAQNGSFTMDVSSSSVPDRSCHRGGLEEPVLTKALTSLSCLLSSSDITQEERDVLLSLEQRVFSRLVCEGSSSSGGSLRQPHRTHLL